MGSLRRAGLKVIAALTLNAAIGCSADSRRELVAPKFAISSELANGASASGHGNFTQAPGVLRTFSFEGRVMPNARVEGNYNNHNRLTGAINIGDIDCLRRVGTNGAVLSGIVRKHTDPSAVGRTTLFRVEDNGEGENAVPDRISIVFVLPLGSPLDCTSFTPPDGFMLPIEGGNVQIRF